MTIEWSDELESDDSLVNAQHKEIFTRINDLFKETDKLNTIGQKEEEIIGNMLRFLAKYTIEHFRDEEDLMRKNHYDKIDEHKKLHDEFIKVIQDETDKYEHDGPDLESVKKLNNLASKWLINHILTVDLEMIQSFKILNLSVH